VRKDVLVICDRLAQATQGADSEESFWIGATKVEALVGLGRKDEAATFKAEIVEKERQRLKAAGGTGEAADWKERTLNEQLQKLEALLPPVGKNP
jgi:hypothetical protein